jgi:CubicO group peptidase (beta-lactamase class C family)
MLLKITTLVAAIVSINFSPVYAQQTLSTKEAVKKLQKDIPGLMQQADIPGMSVALIRNGKFAWSSFYGLMNSETKQPVTAETVFEAASLSKSVFAYGVLKLVDAGKLSLDTPLVKYLGNDYNVPDPRIRMVTARHVLSHSSGFPNWREFDGSDTLLIHFTPGEKWRYSGEGIVYLSKVVEKITGLSLEDFMQQTVLQPLGMRHSSYTWLPAFDSLKTYRHDRIGKLSGRSRQIKGELAAITENANAAASLSTNAEDYAKFILAVLNGIGIKENTRLQMITPQIRITAEYPQLAWGLGVGLETMPSDIWIYHLGDNGDSKAFFMASLQSKNAVVYFANASMGLSIRPEILADAVGGDHPSLKIFAYESYNTPKRLLFKAVVANGAQQALSVYKATVAGDSTQKISEEDMNDFGYGLLNGQKVQDALEVFKYSSEVHPESWQAWEGYAKACMNTGDKQHAIEYCQKSLQINPSNSNGQAMLKKLQTE